MLLPALLLPLLLRCLRGHGEERVPFPPADVRFQARLFRHLLCWKPSAGGSPASAILYEVQYLRVGSASWRIAPNCTRIARLSCDLTSQTRQPRAHYLARVRSLAGNLSSGWSQSRRFAPAEATLWLSKVTLSRSSNRIHVSLQLPSSRWANLTAEDSYLPWRKYHTRVRRVSNNAQTVHVHSSLDFELPPLAWGEHYCISVMPQTASRPNPAQWTEEQCVAIPPWEDHTELNPRLALLTLLILGILGAGLGWASACMKKPIKMPPVLKSPLKHSSSRGPAEEGNRGCSLQVEAESVQRLSLLGPQDQYWAESRRSPCSGARLPEKSSWLAGGTGLQESWGCSMDSGICMQEPSGSLGELRWSCMGPPQGTSPEQGLRTAASSLHIEEQLQSGEGSPQEDLPQTHFPGYRKQPGALFDLGGCLAPPSSIDGEPLSQPSLTPGYLKQTFPDAPSGLKGITLAKDLLHRTDQEEKHFPSSVFLGLWELHHRSPETFVALGFSE